MQNLVEAYNWHAWPTVVQTWSELVERCEHATFFVTAEWVQTWLDQFGAELEPTILLFRSDPATVRGACLLVRRTERKGPFAIRRLYLNTAGEDDRHSPCIEFNTLLCEPGYELTMALELRTYVQELKTSAPWDELIAPGFVDGPAFDAVQTAFHELPLSDQVKPAYYVDLDEVRDSAKPYLNTLSGRERTRFRQNTKRYSERGAITLDEASTVDEALQYLDELAVLHQKTWTERGFPGSFSSEVFSYFHRQLIARCFPLGQIQIVRLRAGDSTIGCLYNFAFRSKLYFYQSGYDYALADKVSPGMMVQVAAVDHAAERGFKEYDFMAGDLDYKKRLANHHRDLHWATWKARSVKMRTFELLRRTRRKVKEHSAAAVANMRSTLRTQE